MIETGTVIIGAGQAGVPLVRALAEAGQRPVLIERGALGGSCVNWGCTPSKAVIASARLAAQARRAAEWGVRIPEVAVDYAAVMDRARRIVAASRDQLEADFARRDDLVLLRGHARLAGRDGARFRVVVGDDAVLADRVVLDTGTRSVRPELPGLDALDPARVIDAENWLDRSELPRHLAFLGGGIIALELAQAHRRLGAAVTILERGERLSAREEDEVGDTLADVFRAEGIDLRLGAQVRGAEPMRDGVRLVLDAGGAVAATHLFLAVGRQPNTDDLGLETVGLAPDAHGVIEVDERLNTAVPGIMAAGDIRGGPQFTHAAYDDFRVLQSACLGDGRQTTRRILPYAVFTEPELGRVGLTARQARAAGHDVRIGRRAMADSGKAVEIGRPEGFIQVVAEAGTDRILGATCLCHEGAELVQLFVELMNAGATTRTMLEAVHIHPTLAEAAKNAVATIADGEAR